MCFLLLLSSLEYCIKETMHRAFWDILRSSLDCDPPDYEPALRLLEEVKQVCDLFGYLLSSIITIQYVFQHQ